MYCCLAVTWKTGYLRYWFERHTANKEIVCSGGLWDFLMIGVRLNFSVIHQKGLLQWFI